MKPNPDDRRDNAEKIQENIKHTRHNIELAEEMIARTSDEKAKKDLQAKNARRKDAVQSLKHEMQDETEHAER